MSAAGAQLLSGWGRTPRSRASVAAPETADEVAELLRSAGPRGVLARGLGRAYGDAAQNAGGSVVDMTRMSAVSAFDVERGVVTVEAGMSLDALASAVLPFGWFLPVSPGTAFVTVGGAIASDVHGKNHHRDGSFCGHVERMTLVTPDGAQRELTPGDELFWATAGGMGLTGVLVEATVRLLRVETAHVVEDVERTRDLEDCMTRMSERDDEYRYSVAWIDCLARGRRLGRSVLLRGDHASVGDLPAKLRTEPLARRRGMQLAAPPWAPNGLLRRETVAAFNEAYYRRAPRSARHVVALDPYFYPLDSVRGWNRIYGERGFLQYQLVVPFGREDALRGALERLSGARVASFLAVLKRFGPESRGLISFPMPGWTLTLDIPAAPGLAPLLDGLDELVADAGGRLYFAKDSRLRPELVAAMYPRLEEWRALQRSADPGGVMRSDLSRRLGLIG